MKKTFKRTLCGIFVLVFMLANANVALAGNNIVFSSELIEPELYYTASNGSFDNLEKYIGDIDDFQKYILENIMTDDSNLTDKNYRGYIDVSMYNIPYSAEMFAELANLINNESPELFRIKAAGISYYPSGNIVALTPSYVFSDPAYFRDQYDVFVDVSEKMLNGIKGNGNLSDVEKALLLHDRLIEYCEYDYESYLSGSVPDSSHSAYGVFCLGTAVCQGYAYAYDYLLEQVGIEAEYCASDALNHAWNIVYIDGKPYHVDVTSDDPVWDISGRVNHTNFLRSTEGIKSVGNHKADDYIATPVDTTYDDAFWQNSTTAFQLVDNKIYYIDNEKQELNVIDDITDTTPETIAELDYIWTTSAGSYYNGNFSRLASIRGEIFYSAPTAVYSYNPITDKTETVLSEEDIVDSTGVNSYRIYGMTAVGCTLWGEYSETPNYNSETKRNQIFTRAYHNPTENWKVVIEPTSSSQGKEKNYCIDCGREVGSRLIPALSEHNFGEWYIDPNNKPTCTEKGVKKRDCQDVGCDVFEWDYADELGHNYSDTWTVDLEPTCVDAGEESRHCTRCGDRVDIQSIDATGVHVEGDAWIKGKDATCKEEGYLYKACKGCGKEMSTQVILKGECSDFSVAGHKDATCLVNGYSGDKTCRDCGTVYKGETILAKGHKVVTIEGKPATCTATGLTDGKKCSVCDTVTVNQQVIAKTSHKITIVGKKNATTKEVGYTGDKVCSVCKTVIEKGIEIPKILTLATPTVTQKNTAKGIEVNWNAIENAESYIVYRSVLSGSNWSKWSAIKKGVTTTSYVDTTVKLGTKYKYTVRAVNGGVMSKYVGTSSMKYNVTPTVKVAVASNGIKVSWSTAANATGYTVYKSEYNSKTKKWSNWKTVGTVKASKTSWTDKSVKSGTQYKYTIRAVNGKVLSSYNKTGAATLYLAQPTVKIANASTGVKVSWNKVTGATGYTVYRSEYKNGAWTKWASRGTAKANKTSWTDTKVASGVQYKYTVRAINGKVASTYVSSNTVLYLAQPDVTFENASNGVKVSWNKIAGATGCTVYSSTYNAKTKKWSGWSNRGTTTKTSWTDTKVKSGTYYKYTVRAVNGNTKSTYLSTNGLIYLAQPTVKASLVSNGVNVTWNKVSGATGYRIYRKANNETKWSTLATVKGTTYNDVEVSDGNSYSYTVRAYKGKVWSSYNTKGVTVSLDRKKQVFNLVNTERQKAGLEPLGYYSLGQKAADIRAKEVALKFSHERPDGTMCFTAFEEIGVSYYSAGENIAKGYGTPEIVMNAWMNSPGHKANILNPNFTHIIVGYDEDSNSWVQLFLGNPYTE